MTQPLWTRPNTVTTPVCTARDKAWEWGRTTPTELRTHTALTSRLTWPGRTWRMTCVTQWFCWCRCGRFAWRWWGWRYYWRRQLWRRRDDRSTRPSSRGAPRRVRHPCTHAHTHPHTHTHTHTHTQREALRLRSKHTSHTHTPHIHTLHTDTNYTHTHTHIQALHTHTDTHTHTDCETSETHAHFTHTHTHTHTHNLSSQHFHIHMHTPDRWAQKTHTNTPQHSTAIPDWLFLSYSICCFIFLQVQCSRRSFGSATTEHPSPLQGS